MLTWPYTVRKVHERDGGICGICHRPVNLRRHGEASVDHILPKSQGGTDDWNNLQLAHSLCNKRKQDTDPERELTRVINFRVRVSESERAQLQRLADADGVIISEYVRQAVLGRMEFEDRIE